MKTESLLKKKDLKLRIPIKTLEKETKTGDFIVKTEDFIVKIVPQVVVQIVNKEHKLSTNTLYTRKFKEREGSDQKFRMQKDLTFAPEDKEPAPTDLRPTAESNIRYLLNNFFNERVNAALETNEVPADWKDYLVEIQDMQEEEQEKLS